MSDVAFIVLTIVVFAVMAVVVRGVERLVGQVPSSHPVDLVGSEQGPERPGADSGDGSGGRAVRGGASSVGADGVGVPAAGQVTR